MMSLHHNVTSHVVTSLAMSLRWDQISLNSAGLLSNHELDLSPTTLTYDLSLAKVKVNSHTKIQGHHKGLTVQPGEC